MKKKNTGTTASDFPRPEIIKGDIYLDGNGDYVTVTRVNKVFINYIIPGYLSEFVIFREQFERDFIPLKNLEYYSDDSGTIAQRIAKLRNQIARNRIAKEKNKK
ncbi:DUF4222 domain-containing protein [Escherichia coli]|nr:DUF4222 domain-containing protein [Escherichia coli]HDY2725067.1 DUF4222 domain-containing protein [Escherichia coli]